MKTNLSHREVLLRFVLLAVGLSSPVGARAVECEPAPPNVVFLVDTSGSMAHVIWHPDFDPSLPTVCTAYDPVGGSSALLVSHDQTVTQCGTTRVYRVDDQLEAIGVPTRFDARYLNWLHDLPDGDPRLAEIAAVDNGVESDCLGGASYAAYQESRLTQARRLLREVMCQMMDAADPRLALARLRDDPTDPAGGYLAVALDDDTPAHQAELMAALAELEPGGWGPLGEALFQVATYFMSREPSETAYGVDQTTRFPVYEYGTSPGGPPSPTPPPDPVDDDCRENRVVLIADDAPTQDDFDPNARGTAQGFQAFQELIGNYNPDDATPEDGDEEPGSSPTCPSGCGVALYLDDIAAFVHENDIRPDRAGTQTLKIYTVALGLDPFSDALLQKTAAVGGGSLYANLDATSPSDASLLAAELLSVDTLATPALGMGGRVPLVLALLVASGVPAYLRSRRRARVLRFGSR